MPECKRCGRTVDRLGFTPTNVSLVTHKMKHGEWLCRNCQQYQNCGSCLRFQSFNAENAWLGYCKFLDKNVNMTDRTCDNYLSEWLLSFLQHFFILREDAYAIQWKDGNYRSIKEPVTTQVLKWHLAGVHTVGAYQIVDNMVEWLAFDVDPEHVKDPVVVTRNLYHECKNHFPKRAVWLEASRHPDPSFHIWVFFKPVPLPAKIARWLGLRILKATSTKVELFPKQDYVEKEGYGNLVKIPFGYHRVAEKWSWFINPFTLQRLSIEVLMNVQGCSFMESDVEQILKLAEKEQPSVQNKFSVVTPTYKRKGKVRQCFVEALKTPDLPHLMRVGLVAEYVNSGLSADQIIELFRTHQKINFNMKKTTYQVQHIIQHRYHTLKCATIEKLEFCIGEACPIFRARKRKFEAQVEAL